VHVTILQLLAQQYIYSAQMKQKQCLHDSRWKTVINFKANTYIFTVEAEIKKLKQNITITSYIFTNSFKDSLISQ